MAESVRPKEVLLNTYRSGQKVRETALNLSWITALSDGNRRTGDWKTLQGFLV